MKLINSLLLILISFQNNFLYSQDEYKDVAQIFINRCTTCHHSGKIHPDFTTYSNINNYNTSIIYNLQNDIMPPWPPDTSYSRFVHERIITQIEKTKIINWLSNGALAGDTTLAPQAPNYPKTQLNGTADLTITIPTYTSTATTTDHYICFSVPTNLTQDKILRAYEIIPGNASIVHHATVLIDTVGNSVNDLSGACYTNPAHISLGSYAPGAAPIVFPSVSPYKFGIKLKAGSKIVFEMHYPEGSIGQVDSTKIRLFFYPINTPDIRPIYIVPLLQNWSFAIPANTTQTVSATYNYPGDISVYSIFPHSHKICRSITNYASNGASTIPLCKINNWNFEWQGFYTYKNFVKIPHGYTLHGDHVYDNTTNNPNNPNPIDVSSGLFTSDEMLFDGFMFTPYQTGDENINIDSIIKQDPLFNNPTSVKHYETNTEPISVYPIPFSDKISFKCNPLLGQITSYVIYNILNQEVYNQLFLNVTAGNNIIEWDGKNQTGQRIEEGVYFVKINLGSKNYCKKIIYKPND